MSALQWGVAEVTTGSLGGASVDGAVACGSRGPHNMLKCYLKCMFL
jgi:hypothetical protein